MGEINEDNVIAKTNWYGHPADSPMRLVIYKRNEFPKGTQLYALTWQSTDNGYFWGTYDVRLDELGQNIVEKIRLQDGEFVKYKDLFFKDNEIKEQLQKSITAVNNKIRLLLAIF